MEIEFVSLTVEVMQRAAEFYTEVLGQAPARADERLTVFELEGIKLSLWNASEDGAEVEFGENCVAAFRVEDLEAERSRIEQLGAEVTQIEQPEDGYRLFHFRDPAGNLLEVFEGEKY
jgi:predicted enzyme related to lactoylglutathione lyase